FAKVLVACSWKLFRSPSRQRRILIRSRRIKAINLSLRNRTFCVGFNMERAVPRRYPIGAELIKSDQTHFRVWAPKAHDVDLVLEESADKNAKRMFQSLTREENGYFSGSANVGAGALYRFRVNKAEHFHPDPASRFQPHGPHGSSCIVEPTQFKWADSRWRGVKLKGQTIYEMHIGTFTKEGAWLAAADQLAELPR